MINGPDLWREILTPVRAAFGDSAVIAGGAVRDWLLGYDPKDIDVFVNLDLVDLEARAENLPDNFNWQPMSDGSYEEAEVRGVLDGCVTIDGQTWPLQFIGRRFESPLHLMSQFDMGICRCWFDGEIKDTRWAYQDRLNRRLTVVRNSNLDRTIERAKRFIRRHPGQGWKFVAPEEAFT